MVLLTLRCSFIAKGKETVIEKKKDVEEDLTMTLAGEGEEFPTLEEAAWAAAGIKPGMLTSGLIGCLGQSNFNCLSQSSRAH